MLVLLLILLSNYLWAHESIGVYAVKNGNIICDQNAELSLNPASCMKLVTTAAALHLLGPDFRFETYLEYDGTIVNKKLSGNLYVKGTGDPCLGSVRFGGWQKQIQLWVDAIQKLGIDTIEGKICADAKLWEKALAPAGWSWEDLGNYYGAGASALSFNENSYTLHLKPGLHVGDQATILRTDPHLFCLNLQNELKTGPAGSGDCAWIFGCEYFNTQFVRGTIPCDHNEFAIRGSIPDPSNAVVELLCQELRQKGIIISDFDLTATKRTTFHTTYSPPVKEIVYWTNQKSINLYAEHLLKQMGKGSMNKGLEAVKAFWKSEGIEGFYMYDGSGLSRRNLFTAKQLVQMLAAMKKSKHFQSFFDSLPIFEGIGNAKSGTMSMIKCYAGYKDDIIFACIVNHSPQAEQKARELLNDL